MAKGQHLTSYQKGIVKRYYQNKDTLATQKLGEIISDLYLETVPQKQASLWKSAQAALLSAGANPVRVEKIVQEKNLKALADLAGELF